MNGRGAVNLSKYQKLFGIGPLGILISFAVLALLLVLDSKLGHARISAEPIYLRIAGLVLVGIWVCWHVWAIRTIRSWWKYDQLCETGPYRYVRHPMYAGAILLSFPGIALLFDSWVLLCWPVLVFPIWSVLVRKEEKIMSAFFGETYRGYAARTGRLLPRLLR